MRAIEHAFADVKFFGECAAILEQLIESEWESQRSCFF